MRCIRQISIITVLKIFKSMMKTIYNLVKMQNLFLRDYIDIILIFKIIELVSTVIYVSQELLTKPLFLSNQCMVKVFSDHHHYSFLSDKS